MSAPKRKGFDPALAPPPRPKHSKVVCKAADIAVRAPDAPHQLTAMPLPADLLQLLGSPEEVTGFDIETHDWPTEGVRKGRVGDFGCYTVTPEETVAMARVVQLGWTIGRIGDDGVTKKRLVRPRDFVISQKATKFHRISQEAAANSGQPLEDVLGEFMRDVIESDRRHGRVVAHNLEFDAGILLRELNRCGLVDLASTWTSIARKGFCTMSPVAGRWLRQACGEEVGAETAKHTLGLDPMVKRLAPDSAWRLENHHDAGTDSWLTRQLFSELLRRKLS